MNATQKVSKVNQNCKVVEGRLDHIIYCIKKQWEDKNGMRKDLLQYAEGTAIEKIVGSLSVEDVAVIADKIQRSKKQLAIEAASDGAIVIYSDFYVLRAMRKYADEIAAHFKHREALSAKHTKRRSHAIANEVATQSTNA